MLSLLTKSTARCLLLVTLFTSCSTSYHVTQLQGSYDTVEESNGESTDIEATISPYRIQLSEEMNAVLCQNSSAMVKERPESELGNFVSDLCLEQARALDDEHIDFALFNHGGLRTALPEGNITRGKIFELMPFENELVVVEIPRSQVDSIVHYLQRRGGEPIADMRLEIRGAEVTDVQVQGKPLEQRNYRVLTSDYLSNGGDKMVFFKEGNRVGIKKLGKKIRDSIIDHCTSLGQRNTPINTQKDGRITIQE